MKYCVFQQEDGVQRCTVCGAEFSTPGRIRAVCGVERATKRPEGGVGTELKKLLSWVGIKASTNCKCNTKAAYMDYKGVQWCRENVSEILGWLEQAAKDRGLLFSRSAAKALIWLAIKKANS